MKHIVIPCDFSLQSLQPVHDAIRYYPKEKLKITLLHLLDMPSGITDLLRRPQNPLAGFTPGDDFTNACEMLRNRYASGIERIQVIVRYGNTKAFMNNLMEAMQVDAIFIIREMKYVLPTRRSIPLLPLMGKNVKHLIREVNARPFLPEESVSLTSLLINDTYPQAYKTI